MAKRKRNYSLPVVRDIALLPLFTAVYSSAKNSVLRYRKVFRIGTVHYNWPMSANVSQAFSVAHCTDSEDLPRYISLNILAA